MTLEEAIKHCEEKADELNKEVLNQANFCNAREMADCQECARDHEQLAEWLKELKAYKDSEPPVIKINIPEEAKQKLIEELQKPHKLLVLPDSEIEFERPQGRIIYCKECKYQIKEFRSDKREKGGGHYVYACKRFGEMFGYWGWGGEDNEFCSDALKRGDTE